MSEFFVVRKGATALRNETVWDESISYGALGVLARALATPPGADLGYRAFTGRGMGEKAVRRALGELEAAGYRHRFKVRVEGGRLRTVTVFSDVPISREEAMEDVRAEDRARMVGEAPPAPPAGFEEPPAAAEEPMGEAGWEASWEGQPTAVEQAGRVDEGCSTSNTFPQDLGPDAHRAAPPAARWENPRDSGGNGDSTVRRSTVARSTAPRSTAPRWSAALSLRDTNTSSLRSEVTFNQTEPDQTCTSPATEVVAERSGPVGSDQAGQVPAAPLAAGAAGGRPARAGAPLVSAEDVAVVGRCLPESMRALDPAGLAVVAGLLRERLEAGWSPAQIRRVMDQRLPERVGRLSSLVATRLERNVVPGLAPVVTGEAGEGARRETARRRSEELAGLSSRPRPDPAFERALAAVASEIPGADRVTLARAAGERMRSGGKGATGAA